MTTASQKWLSDVKTFDAEKLPPHQKKKKIPNECQARVKNIGFILF